MTSTGGRDESEEKGEKVHKHTGTHTKSAYQISTNDDNQSEGKRTQDAGWAPKDEMIGPAAPLRSWVNVIANKLHKAHMRRTGWQWASVQDIEGIQSMRKQKASGLQPEVSSRRSSTQRHINNSIVNTLGTVQHAIILPRPTEGKLFCLLLTKINFLFFCRPWCCHVTTLSIYTKWGSLLVAGDLVWPMWGESEEKGKGYKEYIDLRKNKEGRY